MSLFKSLTELNLTSNSKTNRMEEGAQELKTKTINADGEGDLSQKKNLEKILTSKKYFLSCAPPPHLIAYLIIRF